MRIYRILRCITVIVIVLTLLGYRNINVFAGSFTFHCWNCKVESSRVANENCPICGWDICSTCGACKYGGCDGFTQRRNKYEYNIGKDISKQVFLFIGLLFMGYMLFIYLRMKRKNEVLERETIHQKQEAEKRLILNLKKEEEKRKRLAKQVEEEERIRLTKQEEKQKNYRKSYQYIYDQYLQYDQKIKLFRDYSYKIELKIDIRNMPLVEIENYIVGIINISSGFLLILTIVCGDAQRKERVYNISHPRVQEKQVHSNSLNTINLLIQAK